MYSSSYVLIGALLVRRSDSLARATYKKEYTTKSRTTRRARPFGPDKKAYDEELDDDK